MALVVQKGGHRATAKQHRKDDEIGPRTINEGEHHQEYESSADDDPADRHDLEQLARTVGVVFIVPDDPEDENYIIDHSTFMLLWDPQVNLKAILKAPHKPDQVAEAIEKIMAASDR